MAPIKILRHLGGLASGIGASSQTGRELCKPASLWFAEPVSPGSVAEVTGVNTGKEADGDCKTRLTELDIAGWGVVTEASAMTILDIECADFVLRDFLRAKSDGPL